MLICGLTSSSQEQREAHKPSAPLINAHSFSSERHFALIQMCICYPSCFLNIRETLNVDLKVPEEEVKASSEMWKMDINVLQVNTE